MKFLHLPTLIERKLASGMTSPGRLKDLSDVLGLIKILNVPAGFSDRLNPYVRTKYADLWGQGKTRFVTSMPSTELLEALRRDGVAP